MANPSLQIGNGKFAIKENDLLGYSSSGTRFFPIPITMTRATLGSRVNPSGLVEDVELLGSELVSCGNFECANPDGVWNRLSNTTISGGKANFSNAGGVSLYQDIGVSSGLVKATFSVTDYTSGSLKIYVGGYSIGTSLIEATSVGDYSVVMNTTSGNGNIIFGSSNNFTGSIDNVSVKEATIDGLARVDYTDGTGSLLVEPQRTNLVTYSEAFDNAYWTKSGATVESGFTSPDGTENAYKLKEDTSVSTLHYFYTSGISVSSTTHNFSVFVKSDGSTKIGLRESSGTGRYATFDLINKSVISQTGTDAKIEELSNDWLRLSFNDVTTTSTIMGVFLLNDSYTSGSPSDNPYTGDGTSGVYIWGAQVEEGSYATSYIKTQGSSVTRNADQYIKTGISDKINSEEGVLFLEVAALSDDGTNRQISISNGTTSERVYFGFRPTTNEIIFSSNDSGYVIIVISNTSIMNKIAFKYKNNDFALWVNGVEVGTDLIGVIPTGLNKLSFDDGNGSSDFYGKVKQLQVFKTALSDSELATLTTI